MTKIWKLLNLSPPHLPPHLPPPHLPPLNLVPLDLPVNHTESSRISVMDANLDSGRSMLLWLIMDPSIEDSISPAVNAITSSVTVPTWQRTVTNSVIESLAIMGEPLGLLKVIVMQGKSLVVRDFKSSDPCVVVKLGNKQIMGEPLGLLKVIVMQGKSLVVRDFKSSDPCVVVKLGNKIMGEPLGLLKVIVMQGKSLVVRDFKSSDPCVVVKLGNKEKITTAAVLSAAGWGGLRAPNTSYFGRSDSALVSV